MPDFQPSPYSFSSGQGWGDALVEQPPDVAEVAAAQAKSQGFFAAQIGKLKTEMVEELHFRKLLVTMVGGAVVMVGTGLVAAWLQQRLKKKEEAEAPQKALPGGTLNLVCTATPAD
jgi:hypothetical protein